jgi:hypothetical protein
MTKSLEWLAGRVADDPFFLACPLRWYAQSEALTDEGLATFLGCTPETLVKVRLCGTPDAEPQKFNSDVATIAERFGLKEAALAKAVRRGLVVLKMQPAANSLLAARDCKKEEPK